MLNIIPKGTKVNFQLSNKMQLIGIGTVADYLGDKDFAIYQIENAATPNGIPIVSEIWITPKEILKILEI